MEKIESEESALKFKLDYCNNLKLYIDNVELDKIIAPSLLGYEDQLLNSQIQKIVELFSKKSRLLSIVKEQNPSIISLNNEIDNTLETVRENIKNLSKNLLIEIKNKKNRKGKVLMRFTNLPEREQEFINIKRRFDINNELYTFLLKKRAEASIITASNTSDIQILDEANSFFTKKISNSRSYYILLGSLLLILFIYVKDYLTNSIKNREELEEITKLPILGIISRNNYKSELALTTHPRSSLAESFRGVRTSLKYFFNNGKGNIVAVHSMVPGEGKTFTAINLSTVLAMNNHKVLLVGCDMRKPRLHDVFEVENNKGLSTYLINMDSLDEIITETNIDNLFY